jgi:hypothetical protein
MERVDGAAGNTRDNATEFNRTAATLSSEAATLSNEVKDFLGALKGLGDGEQLRTYDVDVAATATVAGGAVSGRVTKLSPGFALFVGTLAAPHGATVELRIEGIARGLRTRLVEVADGGTYLQLPLTHDHLTYMAQALARFGLAGAA